MIEKEKETKREDEKEIDRNTEMEQDQFICHQDMYVSDGPACLSDLQLSK